MLVRNKTQFQVHLASSPIDEETSIGVLIVEVAYRVSETGKLDALAELPERKPTDAPDTTMRLRWDGVSVTAAGSALGPDKPPFVRPVVFQIGDEVVRLIVFGDRRWELRGGSLQPTPPQRFDSIALDFTRAFGGGFDIPPGILPGTGLPHPGFKAFYQSNPNGMGYYPSAEHAAGKPLPNIERPDQLIKQWSDQPEPAGFSPCPHHTAMRLQGALNKLPVSEWANVPGHFRTTTLHLGHHAPNALIFPSVAPNARIALDGLGRRRIEFEAPSATTRVALRFGRKTFEVEAGLRSIHVDADEGVVRVVHAHGFGFDTDGAPEWVRVTAR